MLLICIDGLSWNLLDRFRKEGVLPNFEKIINNGVSGELKSMFPLISPRIWATIFTGKAPEKHGIEDFYINSKSIRTKQIWEILRESGYRVGVFRPLTAFTPDQVYSFFVPGYLSSENDTYPVDLKFLNDFCQKIRGGAKISPLGLARYTYNLLRNGCEIRTLLKASWTYLKLLTSSTPSHLDRIYKFKEVETVLSSEVFIYCLKKYTPTFAVFYDNGIDFVSHFYWKYMEPELFNHIDKKTIGKYREAIKKYYILTDEIMGKIISSLGDKAYLVVVSDHGFRARRKEDYTGLDCYDEAGKITDTLRGFDIKVFSLLRLLNLEDKVYGIKSAKGAIFRPKNESYLKEIEKSFRNIRYKESGKQVFLVERVASHVNARVDIGALGGPQSVILMDSSECLLRDFVDFTPARSGDHSLKGVLIAEGPNFRSGEIIENPSVYDIFPTILAIYKIPVPRDVEGKVLTNIFEGDVDVEYVDIPMPTEKPSIKSEVVSEEEANHIKQRLKELGYI